MKDTKKMVTVASIIFAFIAAFAITAITLITKTPTLADGSWTGTGDGRNGAIEVSITTKGGKIVAADIVSEDETDFAKPAEQKILQQAVATGSTAALDTVSGASYTSKGTIAALNAALAAASGKKEKTEKVQNTSCDIVIIGAGGAGLTAATEAASKGAKVIVLEKMGIVGGNTNYATGGLNASETSVQKKLGIEDSNEQFYEDTMNGGHNINDPALVRTMVTNSAATVDWLISLGADLSDVGKMAGSTNKRTHRPQGGAPIGAHLVPVLDKAAIAAGAEIRLNNKVTDIISDNGKASGVKVTAPNGSYTIKAKAVIIATGGFGANSEMVTEYRPELAGFGTTNHKGATGDAFAWVTKFDGALTQMDQIQTHPTVVPGNGIMITEAVRGNGAIMVNREGKRFGDEMATRDVMSKAILSQTGKTAYLLFDDSVRSSLKAIDGYLQQGLLTQADSVSELASKLNMPPEVLTKTVTQYNSYQKSGNDPDFGRKESEMPRALSTAPYYAVEVGPAVHHTMGGLKINTKTEVLNSKDEPIPGLFAAGEVTGGIHGANRLGGNAIADITIFGKIAADTALTFIQN